MEEKLGKVEKQVTSITDMMGPLNNDVYYLMNKYKEIDRIGQHFKQLEKKVDQISHHTREHNEIIREKIKSFEMDINLVVDDWKVNKMKADKLTALVESQ